MTLASDIITSAYRESNVLALTGTLTAAEQAEGLKRLNVIIQSSVGFEAGGELSDLNIGGDNDQSSYASSGVPANARLVLNLAAAQSLDLDPYPYEGQRFAISDAAANLATYNLTLDGNGRKIEGSATLTLSTNSLSRQWLYRADTANWVRISDLALSDEMPFPTEFDDYFVTALAMRLNPRHGAQMDQLSLGAYERAADQLRARYRKPRPIQDTGVRGLLGQSVSSAGARSAFNRGFN